MGYCGIESWERRGVRVSPIIEPRGRPFLTDLAPFMGRTSNVRVGYSSEMCRATLFAYRKRVGFTIEWFATYRHFEVLVLVDTIMQYVIANGDRK